MVARFNTSVNPVSLFPLRDHRKGYRLLVRFWHPLPPPHPPEYFCPLRTRTPCLPPEGWVSPQLSLVPTTFLSLLSDGTPSYAKSSTPFSSRAASLSPASNPPPSPKPGESLYGARKTTDPTSSPMTFPLLPPDVFHFFLSLCYRRRSIGTVSLEGGLHRLGVLAFVLRGSFLSPPPLRQIY